MPTPDTKIFGDFKTNLTMHPVSGDVVVVNNLDSIKGAVKNIVLTQHYERHFKPFAGSNVTDYLFENFGPITVENIQDSIIEAIENNEPRADLLDVVGKENIDLNGFDVTIVFRGINNTQPTQLSVYLEQIR